MTATMLIAMVLAAGTPSEVSLETLRREHPRLLAPAEETARVRQLIRDDAAAAALYRRVKKSAEDLLQRPPVERRLEQRSSPTMLDVSRACVERIYTLATVYRIDGDRRCAERGVQELLAVAKFSDWNPRVFLDTAEMIHAVAIGYDWLYDAMPADHRQTIRQALVEKGLREGVRAYEQKSSWTKARHNWNLVGNGGLTLGALAVAEDEPQLVTALLQHAVTAAPLALAEYAPDGAWGEGPGYWNYATHYAVYMLAALDSALGTDYGLSGTPGFAATGEFCMHLIGPTGQAFNFADSSASLKRAEPLYWLARKFDRPTYAWYERERLRGTSPLDLWWYDSRGARPADLPLARRFRHVDVALLRSAWDDPRAVFVGFKAGDNKVNHGHLELGSFVLDAAAVRWVLAPGPDSYALPGYFGARRWSYYRAGTHGQNTLVIDGKNQEPKAVAPITAFDSTSERSHVVADLSAAYAGSCEHVRRGVALLERRQVLVQDELEGLHGAEVVWQVHTGARVALQGRQAVLQQGKETLRVQILAPSRAEFAVDSVDLPAPQRPMPGVQRLSIRLGDCRGAVRLAVLFTPADAGDMSTPAITPLAAWKRGGAE